MAMNNNAGLVIRVAGDKARKIPGSLYYCR